MCCGGGGVSPAPRALLGGGGAGAARSRRASLGGPTPSAGGDVLTMCLAGEELAVGDLGFAVIMDQCWKMAHILSDAMTPDQQRKFIPPFVADPEATLAIAFTEAGAGSDHQGYYDAPDIDF